MLTLGDFDGLMLGDFEALSDGLMLRLGDFEALSDGLMLMLGDFEALIEGETLGLADPLTIVTVGVTEYVPNAEPSCSSWNVTTSPPANPASTNCKAHSVSPSVVAFKSIAPPPEAPVSVWPAPPSKLATSAVNRRVQSLPLVRMPSTALTPAEVVVIVTQPAALIWYWNVKSMLFWVVLLVMAKRSRKVVPSPMVLP
jgi:hypothetical protein